MKPFQKVVLLVGWLFLPGWLQAQGYDTPPFNFDRSMDRTYVDSLLQATRARLRGLDRFRPSATVDTARMEYLHFMAYVHYSGMTHRDSALYVANQLLHLAERKKNSKYQIKGLLLIERYYRDVRTDYPRAITLNNRILSLIETEPDVFDLYFWRIYRNLGHISLAIGEYGDAVSYFQQSIAWFNRDKKIDPVHLSDLHRALGYAYKGQQQLTKAETHYLLAWNLLNKQRNITISNKAYLTNDLGLVYNLQRKFMQAIPYLRQSIAYWEQLNATMPQADALADLAVSYLGLHQYDKAITTAKRALAQNQKVNAPMLTAYSVLTKAYEHQHDWKRALTYQRLYDAKKWEEQQVINQTESLRSKAKFDRERLEKAQAIQQATIKQLKIDQLRLGMSAQENVRNLLISGLAIISSLGLLLLYYSLRLRRTNIALRTKNREIEMALIKGQTIERKRVATELHDRVSSLLGATKMTFQAIDADILSPHNRKLYENSLNLLNDAVTQVRELSHNLIPQQLLQQDLQTSLESLVRKLNLVGKTVFSLGHEHVDERPLSPEVKFNLYVICLELCSNILRHAQAKEARIKLIWDDTGLSVQIEDDGIGVQDAMEDGMGLYNIRERAEAIGAQFWLEPGETNGTKASIFLPVLLEKLPA
ncbi:tetratricopeptide repeat-containing sensor histidine kinase [Fibrisoma limi]|nr:tetratricopeptide repeat-containing sensor histidine kinase [Fibrisoma limi]